MISRNTSDLLSIYVGTYRGLDAIPIRYMRWLCVLHHTSFPGSANPLPVTLHPSSRTLLSEVLAAISNHLCVQYPCSSSNEASQEPEHPSSVPLLFPRDTLP